mgnify:FL=1
MIMSRWLWHLQRRNDRQLEDERRRRETLKSKPPIAVLPEKAEQGSIPAFRPDGAVSQIDELLSGEVEISFDDSGNLFAGASTTETTPEPWVEQIGHETVRKTW